MLKWLISLIFMAVTTMAYAAPSNLASVLEERGYVTPSMVLRFSTELKLSGDQIKALKSAQAKSDESSRKMLVIVKANEQSLAALFKNSSEKIQLAQVENVLAETSQARLTSQKAQYELLLATHDILTAAQIERLRDLKKKMEPPLQATVPPTDKK